MPANRKRKGSRQVSVSQGPPSERLGLPKVWIGKAPAKKGSQAFTAWAHEQFLELLRHGYNFTQAAEELGLTTKWWQNQPKRHPEFVKEARAIRSGVTDGTTTTWEYPDLSQMTFGEFVARYAGFELAEHQVRIAEALEDPLGKIVLVLGHPESGKSTLISLWYPLYRIAQNPDVRIALVTKNSTKAQDLLTRVKRYLTESQLYDDAEGNLVTEFNGWKPERGADLEWSQNQFFVKHRTSGERDATVQALGIGKQIYGSRLDYLILDDALVGDNQQTEITRNRIDTWFDGEARSRAQKGQTIVNGTRLLPMDLYGQWKKAWKGLFLFRSVIIPAMIDEYTEDERVSWPEYWTLDGYDLFTEVDGVQHLTGYQMGMRDIRASITAKDVNRWKLIYQQEDVEEDQAIFTNRHIEQALELGSTRPLGVVYPHEKLILGIDPATTGRAAAVLLAVDPITHVRTVVDLFVGSGLGATGVRQQLMYQFWEKYRDHGVDITVIETNFAKTLLGDEGLVARAHGANTQLVDHHTTGRGHRKGNKWDEEYGVASMSELFGSGLMAFASGALGDREKLQPLIDDLIVFPWSDTQDGAIALWVANGEANSPVRSSVDQDDVMRRRGVPPIVQQRRRNLVSSRQ